MKIFLFLVAIAVWLNSLEAGASLFPDGYDVNAKKFHAHTIRSGETIAKIGKRHGLSVETILSLNPQISNVNIIVAGKQLVLNRTERTSRKMCSQKSRKRSLAHLQARSPSMDEKISILKDVAKRTGLPWEVLAGLTHQESGFGAAKMGDGGRSAGPFQINLPSHPEVKIQQALDFGWSANWAGDYLVSLGARDDLKLALRLWNGSCKNPKTLKHANLVMHWAKSKYGYVANA